MKIIFKIVISGWLSLAILAVPAMALGADLTFDADTTINIPDFGNFTIVAVSTADSMTVNTGNVQFTLSDGQSVTIQDASGRELTNTVSAATTCLSASVTSQVVLAIPSGDSQTTVTMTPGSATQCTTVPTVGGGGGGGGGGRSTSSPAPTTPTTETDTTTTVETPDSTSQEEAAEAPVSGIQVPSSATSVVDLVRSFGFDAARDEGLEQDIAIKLGQDFTEFGLASPSVAVGDAATNFVAYGISRETVKLGSGERRAVYRDYLDTVKRVPTSQRDWEDIQRITTGEKPIGRNLDNEVAQLPIVLRLFETVYGRRPIFENIGDDMAWNYMMYRIRPPRRDLDIEYQGILQFRQSIGREPRSPQDWSMVKALAYIQGLPGY